MPYEQYSKSGGTENLGTTTLIYLLSRALFTSKVN